MAHPMHGADATHVRIERAEGEDTCVVRFDGELDLAVVAAAKPLVQAMIDSGCTSFVLDLSNVTYADSSALGLIVWLNDRIVAEGGRIVAAGADRNVTRVLELSGLLSVAESISASDSAEDALDSLALAREPSIELWTERFEARASVDELAVLRRRVIELTAPLGLSEQALFDLKVAVGEALANAVRHGSPRGEADSVGVAVTAYADRVAVDVSDSGPGFDGSLHCGSDLYAPCGRGVVFMRALTDALEFREAPGGGTVVRLVKHLRRASE